MTQPWNFLWNAIILTFFEKIHIYILEVVAMRVISRIIINNVQKIWLWCERCCEFVKSCLKLGVKQYTWVYSKFWTTFCKFGKSFQSNHVIWDSIVRMLLHWHVFIKILQKKSKFNEIWDICDIKILTPLNGWSENDTMTQPWNFL